MDGIEQMPLFLQMKNMDKTTLDLLTEFLKQGGKLAVEKGKPEYLEGEKYAFDELKATATLADIEKSVKYKVYSDSDKIRTAYREAEWGKFLYVVNLSENDETAEIEMTTPYPYGYNIEKTEKYPLVIENGRVKLKLEKGGSAIIFEGEKPYETAKEYKGDYVDISGEWKIIERPINSLTIDKARLSYDGKDYGEKA